MMNNLTLRIRVYHLTEPLLFFTFHLFHFILKKINTTIWLFFKFFGQYIRFFTVATLFKIIFLHQSSSQQKLLLFVGMCVYKLSKEGRSSCRHKFSKLKAVI